VSILDKTVISQPNYGHFRPPNANLVRVSQLLGPRSPPPYGVGEIRSIFYLRSDTWASRVSRPPNGGIASDSEHQYMLSVPRSLILTFDVNDCRTTRLETSSCNFLIASSIFIAPTLPSIRSRTATDPFSTSRSPMTNM
jgi:hypothetical protein